jgi:MFS family permease
VTTAAGWRSVFWICAGYGVFLFLFLFLFFPETYRLDHQWDRNFTKITSQTTLVEEISTIPAGKQQIEDEEEIDQSMQQQSTTVHIPLEDENQATMIDESAKARFNPFRSFLMLKYTFVCFVAIEIGFCFGTMFTLETLIPDLYYVHYGFDSWQTGKI